MDRRITEINLPERGTQAEALRDFLEAAERMARLDPLGTVGSGTVTTLVRHIQALETRIAALEAKTHKGDRA
jgi:pyridoxal biosynthesis lyase PdxS